MIAHPQCAPDAALTLIAWSKLINAVMPAPGSHVAKAYTVAPFRPKIGKNAHPVAAQVVFPANAPDGPSFVRESKAAFKCFLVPARNFKSLFMHTHHAILARAAEFGR